jgi:hypothetical protein
MHRVGGERKGGATDLKQIEFVLHCGILAGRSAGLCVTKLFRRAQSTLQRFREAFGAVADD